jgi:hypothetical protein
MIQDVGYYGVLALSLWAVGASADVVVVTSTNCGGGVIVTCPSGYVITGSTGGTINSTNNPTSVWLPCGSGFCGTDTCVSIMAYCAKVCQ